MLCDMSNGPIARDPLTITSEILGISLVLYGSCMNTENLNRPLPASEAHVHLPLCRKLRVRHQVSKQAIGSLLGVSQLTVFFVVPCSGL